MKESKLRLAVALILCLILAYFTFSVIVDDLSSAQSFDHSQCQYPDRTTNPPNGCDNSDPCDPANVKGAGGECVDPPKPKKVKSHNKKPVYKPVESVYNYGK